jgi:ubiquitin-protein ligase
MSAQAIKRASADYAELQKPVYSESGIYYAVDETDVRHGWACVFGPKDTPYEDCPMLYEVRIPDTYPFDPPDVKFRTYDGKTRFHPNMYIDGKCCLSILHTWAGPKWASTMRLSTVFLTLQSLMDSDPIRHEPGYSNPTSAMAKGYSDFVEHSCIRFILECAEGRIQTPAFQQFQTIFQNQCSGILDRLETRLRTKGEQSWSSIAYQMGGQSMYGLFLERVVKLKANLNSQSQ